LFDWLANYVRSCSVCVCACVYAWVCVQKAKNVSNRYKIHFKKAENAQQVPENRTKREYKIPREKNHTHTYTHIWDTHTHTYSEKNKRTYRPYKNIWI